MLFWTDLELPSINLWTAPRILTACPCVKGDARVNARINGKIADHALLTVVGMVNAGRPVQVASYNRAEGVTEYVQVTHAFQVASHGEVVRVIDDSGRFVECAPDHKIWTENRHYVMARNLDVDDVLRHSDGRFGYDVRVLPLESKAALYELTVSDNHNFYANGILVYE